MSDWFQIGGVSGIVLLMLFALAAILDNPNRYEFKRQMVMWCCAAAVIIGQAIW